MEQNDIKQLTDTIGVLSKYNDFASRALSGQIQKYLKNSRSTSRFQAQKMENAGILKGSNKPKDVIEKENRPTLMEAKEMYEANVLAHSETSIKKTRKKKDDTTINE